MSREEDRKAMACYNIEGKVVKRAISFRKVGINMASTIFEGIIPLGTIYAVLSKLNGCSVLE